MNPAAWHRLKIGTLRPFTHRLLGNSRSLPYRWRGFATAAGAGYSSSWQQIDGDVDGRNTTTPSSSNSHPRVGDKNPPIPPNPIEYLRGVDAVPESAVYKKAILEACHLQPSQRMLDVGCGTGTDLNIYSERVGDRGEIVAIDKSHEIIRQLSEERSSKAKANSIPHQHDNVSLEVADAYQLPFSSQFFDVVKEDRVLEHLVRPFEATQELLRVVKPGGLLVVANPDFRTFQIDIAGNERRWGDSRRPPPPPPGVDADFDRLTTKVLNGVVPTLAQHPAMGLQGPRLLRRAGCTNIELQTVPVPLIGRKNLESIVPITYMAELSEYNGHITESERKYWLERLEWEGDDDLFGLLNMYICRGIKPWSSSRKEGNPPNLSMGAPPPLPPSIGTRLYEDRRCPKPQHDARIRVASHETDSEEFIESARTLINNEYGMSDSGITLSSIRLRPEDIRTMVRKGELLVAEDEGTGELLGCVQVLIKEPSSERSSSEDGAGGGLPDDGEEEDGRIGEFTCLAVSSSYRTTVVRENTQQVSVERTRDEAKPSFRGRGIGAALVRSAEARARELGAGAMRLAIMCPAEGPEPEYKRWLRGYYLTLGYRHKSTIVLDFETDADGTVVVDQLHAMYEPLHQLVRCKAILFEKAL